MDAGRVDFSLLERNRILAAAAAAAAAGNLPPVSLGPPTLGPTYDNHPGNVGAGVPRSTVSELAARAGTPSGLNSMGPYQKNYLPHSMPIRSSSKLFSFFLFNCFRWGDLDSVCWILIFLLYFQRISKHIEHCNTIFILFFTYFRWENWRMVQAT